MVSPDALNLLEGAAGPQKREKIKFQCFYCGAEFAQFKDAVKHYLQEHHQPGRSDKK
jgi:hypothetical protein